MLVIIYQSLGINTVEIVWLLNLLCASSYCRESDRIYSGCVYPPLFLTTTSTIYNKHQHNITMSSTTTQKQMFEGLGAPVNVAQTEGQHIDPTLDSCCQREVRMLMIFFQSCVCSNILSFLTLCFF